jgi:hypothetical protein
MKRMSGVGGRLIRSGGSGSRDSSFADSLASGATRSTD